MNRVAVLIAVLVTVWGPLSKAQESRLNRLEKQVEQLAGEVARLEKNGSGSGGTDSGLSFGGYGEIHAALGMDENSTKSVDIHRLVFYTGYDFNEWISLRSEVEIEHAYARDTHHTDSKSGGEVVIEQLFLEFQATENHAVRVGRVLIPVGLINERHEPAGFNGVERPNFDKYIIPTTFFADGIGLVGQFGSATNYQLYLTNGLDGSGFSSSGIRGGRMKESPGYSDAAVSGRIDHAFSKLRVGFSGYHGGIDNGNKGKEPGLSGDFSLAAFDAVYSVGNLDLKAVIAHSWVDGAEQPTLVAKNVAEEMAGYSLEAGYHVLPNSWKSGKMAESDLIVFVRYDEYDTQYNMPDGVTANESKDLYDWTTGLTWKFTDAVAAKADFQYTRSDDATISTNTINLGVAWDF